MAQNESNTSFSNGHGIQNSICARCGKAAEVHLLLLGGAFHQGETFCLACGEVVLYDWRRQRTAFAHPEQGVVLLPGFAGMSITSGSLLHSDSLQDEIEGGIIFWEGHGWSSDGPFAGA